MSPRTPGAPPAERPGVPALKVRRDAETDLLDGRVNGASPAPQPEPESHEFSWSDGVEVVSLQCPVAVYTNPNGGVVIRQDQTGMMGEDVFIVLADHTAVRTVIAALQDEIGGA